MEMKVKLSIVLSLVLIGAALWLYKFNVGRMLPMIPFAVFIGFLPVLWGTYSAYIETKAKEDAFPEFLRNISESQKSGITLSQAIINSTKIEYGSLSKEVKKMASQISWGIPLPHVLEKFSERVKSSDFLRRSIAIILEAYRSGGEISEVMERVAESARMVKGLEAERKSKFSQQVMVMYAIFFIFIVIIISLNKILLPMFSMSAGQDIGGIGLTMGTLDPNFYRTIFQHMILIQAFFAGLLAGQVGEGSVVAGLKHSVIMLAIGSVAFLLFLPTENVIISIETTYDVFPPGSLRTVEGFVLRMDRTPISDAEVTITSGGTEYATKTDNLGMFSREVVLPSAEGTHNIKIEAETTDGRATHTLEVSVG
jgi:flagellar protein FlaJ